MATRVLVIEDDATTIRLMEARLSEHGYGVILARDGDVGLEKAEKENPDVILLDIEMPRMSGYEFLNELEKISGCSGIPIICLTSHTDMKAIFERRGIVSFVKPVDFPTLFAQIDAKTQGRKDAKTQ
jgi:DNA-binding response OmpR family regulator